MGDLNITATESDSSMQDVADRLEAKLFPSDEPEIEDTDVVAEDEETLPDADDTDDQEDEGSETVEDEDDTEESEEVDDEDMSLADYLGIDEDRVVEGKDGAIAVNMIIDGETKEVPMTDLVSSYQMIGHVNNKSIALENDRKAFEEQSQAAMKDLQERLQGLEQLSNLMDEQIIGDFNSVDWNALEAQDKNEWLIKRQQYADKASKLQQLKGLLQEQGKQAFEDQQRQFFEEQQKHAEQEMERMLQIKPDWKDEHKRKTEFEAMLGFAKDKYGFSEAELNSVQDHRLLRIVLDAMSYHKGKDVASNKVKKKVPKFQKPGASKQQSASLQKARSVKAKKSKLRETGSIDDAASLLLDRMR